MQDFGGLSVEFGPEIVIGETGEAYFCRAILGGCNASPRGGVVARAFARTFVTREDALRESGAHLAYVGR